MFSPTNILVTTDFSQESDKALAAAIDIAGKYKSHVELLYIHDDIPATLGDYIIPETEIAAEKKRLVDEFCKKMEEQVSRISSAKNVPVEERVKFGSHLDEIIREVDDKKIDLLVTAPHERHKWWHVFYSHLTEELANKSRCETLLIRH